MKTLKGSPKPLGPSITPDGINFALFSKNATRVTLVVESGEKQVDFELHRTGDIWHICIQELSPPFTYGYKLDGPRGAPHFYHPHHLLTDPYSHALETRTQWGVTDQKYQPKSLFLPPSTFDWQGTCSPQLKKSEMIIYEMHVRGFTRDASSGVQHPGTFLGLIEKIPYLKSLGINAVELMPIQEFNESSYLSHPKKGLPSLFNYFGYSTVNFFTPMNRYATDPKTARDEFKTLVRELHRNGIEVILDIVFNHTGEKSKEEGCYSFMGIDHSTYYMMLKGHHANFTGCGHTMNLNHPLLRQFVRDVLHYWVVEMHVDGFRFDLASIMNRDTSGKLLKQSALIEELSHDPILSKTKLIAEPWDIGGYQLGGFSPSTNRWSEWNGKYRDAVRKFIKGDPHSKNEFAGRLTGSHDIFPHRRPTASVNFITAHDGFTLHDLVSYNGKHNEINREGNRDGANQNFSWNMGFEGETAEEEIVNLRMRQMKNLIIALMLSKGIPMLLMGDEYHHTKKGNNNTWCQDNELNWFLWDHLNPFTDFVRNMIRLRKEYFIDQEDRFDSEETIIWHGINLEDPNWHEESPILSYTLETSSKETFYIAFNATGNGITFHFPEPKEGTSWYLIVNSNAAPPNDFLAFGKEIKMEATNYYLDRYSSIILQQRNQN